MKIIYIVNARIPTEKAHGIQIMKTCEAFANNNIDIELVIPKRTAVQNPFEFYGLKPNFPITKIWTLNLYRFGYLGFIISALSFALSSFFYLKSRKENFIIYSRDYDHLSFLGIPLLNKSYFFEIHGPKNKTWPHKFLFKKIKGAIITNSFIQNDLVKNFRNLQNKTIIAPNGVDLEKFNLEIPKNEAIYKLKLNPEFINKKILVYTGSFKTMDQEKGIKEIMEAIKILNNSDILFIAVGGKAEDIEYYSKNAEKLGIKNQAIFLPHQTQDQLALFQKTADILLMPFPKIAHYEYFMTPIKMFEYMAGGKPIIASNLPSIKEILNDKNCFFCEPGDFHDLSEKIKLILENPNIAEQKAQQAYLDSKQYSWDKRTKKIISFINKNL